LKIQDRGACPETWESKGNWQAIAAEFSNRDLGNLIERVFIENTSN
jgi:hypothetical protein